MQKKDAAAITLTSWMLAVSWLMVVLHTPDLRLYIAYACVGFFIVVYMVHPMFSKPQYIRRVYAMAIACTVLFSGAIVLEILEIFS